MKTVDKLDMGPTLRFVGVFVFCGRWWCELSVECLMKFELTEEKGFTMNESKGRQTEREREREI